LEAEAKLDKQIKYADSKKIPYVAILGPEEAENSEITVKELASGKQQKLKQADTIKLLKKD
jgi:histidyl-tRNA synthetase